MWEFIVLLFVIILVVYMINKDEVKPEGLRNSPYVKYGNDMITNDQLIRYTQQGN